MLSPVTSPWYKHSLMVAALIAVIDMKTFSTSLSEEALRDMNLAPPPWLHGGVSI